MRPLIGISCCRKAFGLYNTPNHAASDTYVRAVDEVMAGVPVLIPANGSATDVDTLVARLDGIILTGSRSNVEPALYEGPPHPEGVPEDHARDSTTIRLIRAAIVAGIPIFAICRGLQELNVALGGTLHQRLQDLPGRLDHSTPMHPNPRIRTGKAHAIRLAPGSWIHRVAGAAIIPVNSLHNQGIDRLAPGLIAEGTAPDGTIEAVRLPNAKALTIGVQWHPEYDFDIDSVSRNLFKTFADAVRGQTAESLAAD